MDSGPEDSLQQDSVLPRPGDTSVFYDGTSSRRHQVQLVLAERLEISENGTVIAVWPFADIRRADGAIGILRLSCVSAPSLARLEVRDPRARRH